MKSIAYKIYRFLASLKLAVILLVFFLSILAIASYFESLYDAKTAQHLVYGHPLFACFLLLLAANIACSAAIRYPWTKLQRGFVITHIGILTILTGGLITFFWGVDGSIVLEEGQSSQRVVLDESVLFLSKEQQELATVEAEFRWSPPTPEQPTTIQLTSDIRATVLDYIHHAKQIDGFEPDPEKQQAAALRISIGNKQIDESLWLTADGKAQPLGPATFRFRQGKLPDDKQRDLQGSLQLLVNDKPYDIALSKLLQGPLALEDSNLLLKSNKYYPAAAVRDGQLTSISDQALNPLLEFDIVEKSSNKTLQSWMVLALDSSLNTMTENQDPELKVSCLLSVASPDSLERQLEFFYDTQEQTLYYRLGQNPWSPYSSEQTISPGWMDLAIQVDTFIEHAKSVFRMEKAILEDGMSNTPAILLSLEGDNLNSKPLWLFQGDIKELPSSQEYAIGYGLRTVPLDFSLRLNDFTMETNPGSSQAASFKSSVTIDEQDYEISMNQPLSRDGYKIFQASYAELANQPTISVFAVNFDPGLPVKYLGSLILVFGIFYYYYIRPRHLAEMQKNKGKKTC